MLKSTVTVVVSEQNYFDTVTVGWEGLSLTKLVSSIEFIM